MSIYAVTTSLLIPLAAVIAYYDVRYRRIPNPFVVVVITGGVLAVISMIRSGMVVTTMHRVLQIFVGMLPGWQMPKFAVPADRTHTIPYGVAITMGSIISMAIFRT